MARRAKLPSGLCDLLRKVVELELGLGNRIERVEDVFRLEVYLAEPLHLDAILARSDLPGLVESDPDLEGFVGVAEWVGDQQVVGPDPSHVAAPPPSRKKKKSGPLPPFDEWLKDAIAFFRPLGFFAGKESDARLAKRLAKEPFAHEHLGDLKLLAHDHARVWWEDTEADVMPGNDVYPQVLAGWAAISRGAFAPKKVRERWSSDESAVELAFELEGKPSRITLHGLGDWLDMKLLGKLNALLAKKGTELRFEMVAPFDQTAFVVVLDPAEKRALVERGWRF